MRLFVKEQYDDRIKLNGNENVDPSIEELTVDYFTRYVSGQSLENAFMISFQGARKLDVHHYLGEKELPV